MDFSSLPPDQQQQLQQLQQQFQEHQAQKQQDEAAAAAAAQQSQQQQYQQYTSQQQAYEPSQVQSYDQSYYSYYQYQDPQQQSQQLPPQQPETAAYHHPHHDQQQYAAYYQTDYANSAYPQQTHQHSQAESTAYQPQSQQTQQQQYSQPEAASAAYYPPADSNSFGLGQGQIQVQHQNNSYNPKTQVVGVGSGGGDPAPVPLGLNAAAAAAVAALSQLTQFAGNMGAAERAMVDLQDRQYGGGYGPMMNPGAFMGPMHFGQGPNPMRPPVGQSSYRSGGRKGGGPFRGGGRGNFSNRPPSIGGSGPPFRGRGRGRGRGGRRHSTSLPAYPEPFHGEEAEPKEEDAKEPSTDNQNEEAQADLPNHKPVQMAWCELCRVDCTSLDILEQHKNGKKHKKNVQRLEEMKSAYKPVADPQKEEEPITGSNAVVPENVEEGEGDKQTLVEDTPTEFGTGENKVETEPNNDQAKEPQTDKFDGQRRGMKRKMRGGRGGKRAKIFGGPSRRETGPPKVVIPLMCNLCNVKCDTQEVFDRHVAGKKHIAKLKRFEGHQAMYGPTGVQALYPPNPIAQTLYRPQGPPQAFYDPQVSFPPPEAYAPPEALNPNPQLSDAPLQFGNQHAAHKAQQLLASVEPETKQATGETYAGNGVPGSSAVIPSS